MTPAQNLIEFILYIVPGFIVLEIFNAYFTKRNISDFSKLSWSLIYGVSIFTIVSWLNERYLNDVLDAQTTSFPNFKLIFSLLACSILVAFLMILIYRIRFAITKRKLHRKVLGFYIYPFNNIWQRVRHESNKDFAVVNLKNGERYIGWIEDYSLDPNSEHQDFLLTKAKKVDENLKVKFPIDGLGVYMNTKDVVSIEFMKGKKREKEEITKHNTNIS